MSMIDKLAKAMFKKGELVIPTPTIAQAYSHLVSVVAEADRRGIKSPTIEAIRVLTAPVDGPKTQ